MKNPLQKDDLVITRLSADGASALAPDQAIFESIRMINTDHKTADMVLTVTVDADTSIIDPGTGTFDGENWYSILRAWCRVKLHTLLLQHR